ncbi:NADH kinase pos5 [Orbilia ellipsospora]|uniref:NADH kinase pos5 n=1 Tax=Orbilia ellipsospora TaxID=2528407 RepID=A0AAV9XLE6_9PEZI
MPSVTEAMVEFAKYLTHTHPSTNIILEPAVAAELHSTLPFPVYATPYTTLPPFPNRNPYHLKTSLTVTFGGDGTILHAASIFSTSPVVPPLLSFSLGTLGFLGPWKFADYKTAVEALFTNNARVMRRSRIKMKVFDGNKQLIGDLWPPNGIHNGNSASGTHNEEVEKNGVWAMNEVNIHRGQNPHMAVVEVYVDGRFLTEAVADGIILSTPTGSTAYSLSSFGSIVHPKVPAILLTPICPRSLSFRPLVLPAESEVTLKLSGKTRGNEVEVSIDGKRWGGVGTGVEVRVTGEVNYCGVGEGGVPCIWREGSEHEDEWVSGLNGLLKFNYPFGEEVHF